MRGASATRGADYVPRMRLLRFTALAAALPSLAAAAPPALPYPPTALRHGALEVVHAFDGPMPTGVTVLRDGRVFVNYPRWGDRVTFTVGELKGGEEVP
jgi:hypothetical protein